MNLDEIKLHKTDRKFHAIFESALDGISLMDVASKRFELVNQAFCNMLLYTSEELTKIDVTSLHRQQDWSFIAEILETHIKGESDHAADIPFLKKNGSLIYADINSSLVSIGGNNYLVGIFRDSTERRKMDETHSRLIEHLEASPYFVGFADATDTNILYINRAGRTMTGLGEDEDVTKLKVADVHPEWTKQIFEEEMLPTATRLGNWQGESAFLHRDGHEIPVEMVLSAHKSLDGKVKMLSTTSRDISERKKELSVLKDKTQKLQLLFDGSRYAMMTLAPPSWKFTVANKAALKLFGASSEAEFTRLGPQDVSPEWQPDGRLSNEKAQEMIALAMKEGTNYFEWEHQRIGDVPFHADVLLTRSEIGGDVFLQATVRDITERKQMEADTLIAATAFEAQEGMVVTDANAVILRVNSAFTKVTGYTAEEAVGQNPRLLKSGRHDAAFYAAMWESISTTGAWEGEIWNRRKNGEIYPEYLTITAVKDSNGSITNHVGTLRDISARKAAEQEIQNLAFYDPLTQLPNRRLLLDRFHKALSVSSRSNQYGAMLFIDMDGFKTINDTLGHDQGDLLLIEVAARIQSCVREGDTVARMGGDEFVVLVENISTSTEDTLQKIAPIAEKIRVALAEPYRLNDHRHYSTPSIGVNLFRGDEESVETLLKRADMAMYQAKDSGRNAVRFFDFAMQLAVEAYAALESDLRKAIDAQQLRLYYQIQMDNDLRPIGAEALLCWIHPQRGFVSPADFIPVAEKSSLILEIGHWVLDTACQQLAVWSHNEATRNLVLAVNISAQQFKQPDFVEQIVTLLKKHNIDPARLKLELTESVVVDDLDFVAAKMLALRHVVGVTLSLDDFGTGFSSLSILKQLPLNQIKIDQSFVRNMTTDSSDAVMVKTIITMAHNFGLHVIAEGVETDAQHSALKENNCMAYQGYLFSKPVPIEQFEAVLKQSEFCCG